MGMNFITRIFVGEKSPTNPTRITICAECGNRKPRDYNDRFDPEPQCLAHPRPTRLDLVTGKRMPFCPGWFNPPAYKQCAFMNNGNCPEWIPIAKEEEHNTNLLPSTCSKCGAPVRGNKVRWIGSKSADCLYCGVRLLMRNKPELHAT